MGCEDAGMVPMFGDLAGLDFACLWVRGVAARADVVLADHDVVTPDAPVACVHVDMVMRGSRSQVSLAPSVARSMAEALTLASFEAERKAAEGEGEGGGKGDGDAGSPARV